MRTVDKVRVMLDARPVIPDLPATEVDRVRQLHGWPSRRAIPMLLQALAEEREEGETKGDSVDCPLCGKRITYRRLHRHQGTQKCLLAVAKQAATA